MQRRNNVQNSESDDSVRQTFFCRSSILSDSNDPVRFRDELDGDKIRDACKVQRIGQI